MKKIFKNVVIGSVFVFSLTALHAEIPWNGTGTPEDPFKISDAGGLRKLSAQVNSGNYRDSCFKLVSDIDLGVGTDTEFTAIGSNDNRFNGVFDGDSHVISNLYINQPSSWAQGFFGFAENASIKNLKLNNVFVSALGWGGGIAGWSSNIFITNVCVTGKISGGGELGGLTGCASGLITNSYSECMVFSETGGVIGGLCGVVSGITIENCFATGNISGNKFVGGLIGFINSESLIKNSFATGMVSAEDSYSGGLIGYMLIGTAENNYARGNVRGANDVGGLMGSTTEYGKVLNSYATGEVSGVGNFIGGLIGSIDNNASTLSNNYWDSQSSGTDTGVGSGLKFGVTAKLTAQMKTEDFVFELGNSWRWDEQGNFNNGYPALTFQPETAFPPSLAIPETPSLIFTAFGDRIKVRASDFGNLNGHPIVIEKKTRFLAQRVLPSCMKAQKFLVRLDNDTIGQPVQQILLNGKLRLLNTPRYKQQLKTHITTRNVLLADSVAHAVQRDSAQVKIWVKDRKILSDSFITAFLVPPTLDTWILVTTHPGTKKETLYLVAGVFNPGSKLKATVEFTSNGKLKKLSAPILNPLTAMRIPEVLDAGFEILGISKGIPQAFKLPKKFKGLENADFVLDNRIGLDADKLK